MAIFNSYVSLPEGIYGMWRSRLDVTWERNLDTLDTWQYSNCSMCVCVFVCVCVCRIRSLPSRWDQHFPYVWIFDSDPQEIEKYNPTTSHYNSYYISFLIIFVFGGYYTSSCSVSSLHLPQSLLAPCRTSTTSPSSLTTWAVPGTFVGAGSAGQTGNEHWGNRGNWNPYVSSYMGPRTFYGEMYPLTSLELHFGWSGCRG